INNIMFANAAGFSVANTFREASYGKFLLTGNVYGPYHLINPPVAYNSNNNVACGTFPALAAQALQMAKDIDHVDPATYDRWLYVLPAEAGCSVAGLVGGETDVPGRTSTIFDASDMTYEHELGHQLLNGRHCWSDLDDPMNNHNATLRLFNAAGTLWLGWM